MEDYKKMLDQIGNGKNISRDQYLKIIEKGRMRGLKPIEMRVLDAYVFLEESEKSQETNY